ncbi:MAG: SpoIIE family protein phosphatase [Magnetococcales bacterium]|nr:SpoIIE family protein phosphatase [Magnetococcales bacterium]
MPDLLRNRFLTLIIGLLLVVVVECGSFWYIQRGVDAEITHQAELLRGQARATLDALETVPRLMAVFNEVREVLTRTTPDAVESMNQILQQAAKLLSAEALYLMDTQGRTLAASNWNESDSFVGKNYSFRPYFKQAMSGTSGMYVAQGVTSGILGLYLGIPVTGDDNTIVGVMVLKYSCEILLPRDSGAHMPVRYFLSDEWGVIFASNDPSLILNTMGILGDEARNTIAQTRKYDPSTVGGAGRTLQRLDRSVEGMWVGWHAAPWDPWSLLPALGGWYGRSLELPGAPDWRVGVLMPNLDDSHYLYEYFLPNGLATLLVYGLFLLGRAVIIQRHRHQDYVAMLVRHVPVAMALFDRDLKYLQASHRWLENHNLRQEEAIGKSHFELRPDLPSKWKEIFTRCLAGHWERREEECFSDDENASEWYTWEAFPWRDAQGRIGGILMFMENVANRVHMERQVRWQRDKLSYERSFIEEIIHRMRASGRFNPYCLRFVLAPVEKTAGDLLLSALRPDGGQHVMLGDFTGHGLTAALGGPLVSDIFYAMTAKGIPMGEIMCEINAKLHKKMPTGMFMAACFLELDPQRRTLQAWNCSMPEMLLYQKNILVNRVASENMALGIIGNPSFQAVTLDFQQGCRIIAFTDGAVEVSDPDGDFLDQEAIEGILTQIVTTGQDLSVLTRALEAYRSRHKQADDITIVELSQQCP